MAEALAQNWGNIQFGIRELEQRNGVVRVRMTSVAGVDHLGAVALAGVVPLDQGVPVDGGEGADGLVGGLRGLAGAVVGHDEASRVVRVRCGSSVGGVVVPRAAGGDDEAVVVAGRGEGRRREPPPRSSAMNGGSISA
jgi:hypothetical protein